jgi:hypothetical protein
MVPASAALQYVPIPDLLRGDGPSPFSLADPDRIVAVLTAARFAQPVVAPAEAPILWGRDADDAVAFIKGTGMARTLLAPVDPATATRALDAVADALRPYEQPDGVWLGGAAWLVTATRP